MCSGVRGEALISIASVARAFGINESTFRRRLKKSRQLKDRVRAHIRSGRHVANDNAKWIVDS